MFSCDRKLVVFLGMLAASLPAMADDRFQTEIVVEPAALAALLASRGNTPALLDCRAGYGDVSNYYASFAEWSSDPALPVVGPVSATAPATIP